MKVMCTDRMKSQLLYTERCDSRIGSEVIDLCKAIKVINKAKHPEELNIL